MADRGVDGSGRSAADQVSLERMIQFSDAVFAIAITLLAVDLRLPELPPDLDPAVLETQIGDLAQEIPIFALSFTVVGGFWVEHLRMFRHISNFDFRFLWLNLVLLAGVAFLPVPSSVLGEFPAERSAVIFYALTLAFISAMHVLSWRYAVRFRFTSEDADVTTIRYLGLRGAVPLLTSLAAAAIALVAPLVALALLTVLFVVAIPLGMLYYRVLSRIARRS